MRATALLAVLVPCLSASSPVAPSGACSYPGCLSEDVLQLLQARADVRVRREECGYVTNAFGDALTMFNNNGRVHTHGKDFSRSVRQVMAEHPGVDGYCYFNQAASYITYTKRYNYAESVMPAVLSLRGSDYHGMNSGELVSYRWEGENVTTHVDSMNYIYDDLYAFSLGFLQNQGLDTALMLRDTETDWVEVSRGQCEKIQETYHFTDEDLILNDLLDANLRILAKCYCATGVPLPFPMRIEYIVGKAGYKSPTDCQTITKREFALHHYMKCSLGHRNSAADMAYLHGRACLIEGGKRIGHFSECPWSPSGM